jgi:hypothetical protein
MLKKMEVLSRDELPDVLRQFATEIDDRAKSTVVNVSENFDLSGDTLREMILSNKEKL